VNIAPIPLEFMDVYGILIDAQNPSDAQNPWIK
jgi:hypothetical protein